jgi:hypothetical protein
MWTRDGSRACDDERHTDCDGVAIMIDQDGESRYRCGCWCHRKTVLIDGTLRAEEGGTDA